MKKIISPLVLLLYLAASIGFGFYNCHCEHSNRITLLTNDHCSCAHDTVPHSETCNNGGEHTDDSSCTTEGDCCQIVYKTIDIDQNQPKVQISSSSFQYSLLAVLTPLAALFDMVNEPNSWATFIKSPPDYSKTAIIYQYNQLRL